MIQPVRSRLRVAVASAICALVAAPTLVVGSGSPAATAPPGSLTGVVTVGGEANDGDSNPWRLYGDAYSGLRNDLVDPTIFGPAGTFNKGRFEIAPNGMTTVNSTDLANLDVFFGGIPRNGWDPAESTALRSFVLNGGGLVLALNEENFGGLPEWLENDLGLSLGTTRAFYGPSDCYPGLPDTAPSQSTSSGSHPVISGPFEASGPLTMYHTANVLTATGSATARYSVNITGTPTRFGVDGPWGDVSEFPFTIDTASINPDNIESVQFSIDGAPFGAPVASRPFQIPVPTLTPGPHRLDATATLVGGGTIVGTHTDINVVAGPVTTNYRNCPGANDETIDNDISGTTVATIEPGALGAGSGPIVVTSDLDFFSNFFTGSSIGPNRTFALNTFAWMMDNIVPANLPDSYFPLDNPIRVYDSRLGGGAITSGASRSVKVAGVTVDGISVPADATSVIANVTAVDPDQAGFLTVYPLGSPPPSNTSTHNFARGENFANTVVMAVGDGGSIAVLNQFYSGTGGTHVLVDVIGYSRDIGTGARLRTMAPMRALDSRVGTGGPLAPFSGGAVRDLQIVGQPGIPVDVTAVVLNMTVANATNTGSFVTVWPSGEPQPNISNINIIAGITRPNLVVAKVGANGKISIVNDSGETDILADIVGYFEPGGTGGSITAKNPSRELDTRPGNAFGPGETRQMTMHGVAGVPAGAKTVILKVTAADPTADGGYLTVWPSSVPQTSPPNVSNLNFNAGMNIPNLVITQIGSDGKINIHNAFGSTHVLVDVLGYAD